MKTKTTAKTLIPSDLVEQILLWLPVKPIFRFRCLSKSLCRLIDSENFVKEHLQRSKENKTNRKLIMLRHPRIYATNLSEEPITYYEKLNHPYEGEHVTRCGVCNGIVLLETEEDIHVLWNPFTRRSIKLPAVVGSSDGEYDGPGLGYDHVGDDYKVVTLSNDKVWIFSLKSNSWKRGPNFPFAEYITYLAQAFFANGSLYWFLYRREDRNKYKKEIIGFDLSTETFYKVPQPKYTPDFSDFPDIFGCYLELNVSEEGCLIISNRTFFYSEDGCHEVNEIHIGEDECGNFTWRKFDIPFKNDFLAYSKKEQKVWLQNPNGEIICYDLQYKIEKKIDNDSDLDLDLSDFVVCCENLLPLGDK